MRNLWPKFICALALIFLAIPAFGSCSQPANAIEAENCLTGTPQQQWYVSGAGDATIQGFATSMSVNVGQTVSFKISTTASSYHIEIYRMGYYQGNGARLITTFTPTSSLAQGQPACLTDTASRLVDCGNWKTSASWTVPSSAVSGIYFAHLVRNDNSGDSLIFFVVRNDASTSAILFQTADESWQAYNGYGGHSLYGADGFDLTNRAYKVSYNRPMSPIEIQTQPLYAEYPMVRWLERNGYDVSYFSSVDAAASGALIKNHKIYLSVGHDEYVSGPKRAGIEAARNAGVNLAFFSGNEFFWKTRWENSIDGTSTAYRTLVCYKETLGPNSSPGATAMQDPLDPPTWTGTWRDPSKSPPADGGRPENALTGQLFRVNGPGSDNTNLSIKIPAADGKMRFWRNTAVANQTTGQTWTLPAGTLGYEWDVEEDNGVRPAGLFDLSTTAQTLTNDYLEDFGGIYGAGTATHRMSLYRAPSGALVFGAGTVQWSWGLDDVHDGDGPNQDVNMQQATVNLFADMGVQPATLQSGLVAATTSTDKTPPTSVITSPTQGSTLQAYSVVTVQGTATDVGGVVGGVEVSTDGGVTWHAAAGRSSWSYTWMVAGSGSVNIRSRAVDDSGNIETSNGGITVNVPPAPFTTIWGPSSVPTVADAGPDNSVELGVKFRADTSGSIVGIRFYKSASNTGTHTASLWTNSGTLLGTATFTAESASGWQQANFSSPVAITANTVYVASYHTDSGHYSADQNYFSASGVDTPPLHALQNGISGSNGLYVYGTGSTFPTLSFNATNYWVDVAFKSAGTLTSIAVTPANSSINSGATQQFVAVGTYTDGSTADVTSEVTWTSSNAGVATISSAGVATGVAGGSTSIVATSGSVSGSTTLNVGVSALAITSASLPGGYLNVNYSSQLTATGGTAPYNWALLTGSSLPPGLSLSTSGVIGGIPTTVGTYTFSVKLMDGGSPQQSATKQFSIAIATAPTSWTIWPVTATPKLPDAGSDAPVELGVQFTSDISANISGIRFYKSAANVGPHVVNLWSSTGTLLATATSSNETASGWQQVNFTTPVAVTANTIYVASYHSNAGHYAADQNFFSSAGVDNAPLHALKSGTNGNNGVFAYGSTSVFPNSGYLASNYWVDVVLTVPVTLRSIAVAPANPTVAVGSTQQFTATGTYSDGSTQDITTQVTWTSSNTGVATINAAGNLSALSSGSTVVTASKSSVSGTSTVTTQVLPLTITTSAVQGATANLPYSAALSATGGQPPYTWSLSSGSALPSGLALSSAGQISGTSAFPGSYSFSVQVTDAGSRVTTKSLTLSVAQTPSSFSIWSSSALPAVVDAGSDAPVELGVRFKADVSGSIAGIRFYKSAANAGPHVVNLWSNTGTLLATATSSNETASGWQQVNFSSPVPITANTVYVASYHTNVGDYSVDQNYFSAAGVDNYPLHALQDGVNGANGAFAYGSTSTFPNSSYLSGNYWVDVAFQVPAALNSIAVTPTNPTVPVGQTQQFTATATYSDGSNRDVTGQVIWSSSNTGVATISSSGLASATSTGTSTITATLGSIKGNTTLSAQVSALAITTSTLQTALLNQPYSTSLGASGGVPSYTWSLKTGSLPAGVGLNPSGQISGTPQASGTFTFTVSVADSAAPANSASKQLSLTVNTAASTAFSPTAVPSILDVGGDSPVELGVKFKSDVAGQIVGIRFYKSAANIGPHIVDLWSSTGTLLATATSTTETASGWQQVNFTSPVSISANTVYVASYHVNGGHYSVNPAFFTSSGVDNPPLHLLQDGVNGGNGVFTYSSGSAFPTSSYNAGNYWVDIAFQ